MHIFLFQKNEDDILEEWINYHAQIVGFENITVVDHNSTDNSLHILLKYAKKGINVRRYVGEYKNKGKILTEEMNKYRAQVHLLIPLDADEFIITHRNGKITHEVQSIKEDLLLLSVGQHKNYARYYFGKIYNYVNTVLYPELHDLNTFYTFSFHNDENNIHKKCFFNSSSFVSTDMGNHYGNIKSGIPKNRMNLFHSAIGLLHFQMRGFNHFNNKNNKNLAALCLNAKGDTVHYGKHWHNDYKISISKGAVQAFTDKYLSIKNVIDTRYNFFEKALKADDDCAILFDDDGNNSVSDPNVLMPNCDIFIIHDPIIPIMPNMPVIPTHDFDVIPNNNIAHDDDLITVTDTVTVTDTLTVIDTVIDSIVIQDTADIPNIIDIPNIQDIPVISNIQDIPEISKIQEISKNSDMQDKAFMSDLADFINPVIIPVINKTINDNCIPFSLFKETDLINKTIDYKTTNMYIDKIIDELSILDFSNETKLVINNKPLVQTPANFISIPEYNIPKMAMPGTMVMPGTMSIPKQEPIQNYTLPQGTNTLQGTNTSHGKNMPTGTSIFLGDNILKLLNNKINLFIGMNCIDAEKMQPLSESTILNNKLSDNLKDIDIFNIKY